MSWNEIRGDGAICVWQALQDHVGLTALDMSWNSIGQQHRDTKFDKEPHKSNLRSGSGHGVVSKGKTGCSNPAAGDNEAIVSTLGDE